MDTEASQPVSSPWRERAPLALVVAAAMANVFTVLALPPLHGHHDPGEVAFFFRVHEDVAASWLGRFESLMEPVRRSATGPGNTISWRGAFLLLTLSPVFGTLTAVFLAVVLTRRPLAEKVLAVVAAAISLPITFCACGITWYALMNTHYLCC